MDGEINWGICLVTLEMILPLFYPQAFFLSFIVLRRTIKLNLNFTKFILKPVIATIAMCVCSHYLYTLMLGSIISAKIATILAIIIAVIIYLLMVIVLKIFEEDEISMLPYGNKIYKIFKKLGIYGENQKEV